MNKNAKSKSVFRAQKDSKKNLKKIKLDKSSSPFGFSSILCQIIALMVFLMLIHGGFFLIFSPKLRRITNLSKIFIMSVESWNAYYTLHVAMIETLFYNNTIKMWDGELSSYDFYYQHREFTKEYILDNFTRSFEYDLGNFTEKYRSDMTTVTNPILTFSLGQQLLIGVQVQA